MPAVVIVGAQWGDEGKGKATDLLGEKVDYVVKPNGGNNAGHTVVVRGEKFELKLLPAGILSPQVTPVIGNGVVVNLEAQFEEIAEIFLYDAGDAAEEWWVNWGRFSQTAREQPNVVNFNNFNFSSVIVHDD